MTPFPNLISDSLLVKETIELLRERGGRVPAVTVVDYVMNISSPAPSLATMLASDLVSTDPRLRLDDDFVELVEVDREAQRLSEADFVVFDLETTGAKAPPCRVTEIGAYRVSKGEIAGEYHSLVNPETPIPEFIATLTGINDDMVREAPRFRELAGGLLDFIGDSVLVAHNAPFDIRFLNHEIGLVHGKYRVANPYLCTVRLSRKLIPGIENHKLATVANFYSIDLTNHHRASADARATAMIFIKLLELLSEKGIDELSAAAACKF
ncbi:MAG TPA: exonuclease domain-containing protein [Aridibacter sp.]|nr:exonuclease domain-containing protein [Aridibacter sp.]